MPKGMGYKKKPMKTAGKYDSGHVAINSQYSTPHQKTLGGSIGVEKALGMGKVGRIGMKMKKK